MSVLLSPSAQLLIPTPSATFCGEAFGGRWYPWVEIKPFIRPGRGRRSPGIHHGVGTDGKLDLKRIAKVITDTKPDLVALQEVDKNTTRTGKVDQAAELAKLSKGGI